MKRKLFLLFIIFLLSGCTVNYNLTIDNDTALENIKISIPTEDATEKEFESQVKHKRPVYFGEKKYYDMTYDNDGDNYHVDYIYKHNINNLHKSSFLNNCYATNNIKVSDEQISISTSNVFRCINLDDGLHTDAVDVNITTKLKVLNNNADEINNNTYTWHMDGYDYSNKPIKLVLQKNKKISDSIITFNKKNSNTFNSINVIFLILPIVLAIIYLFIKAKKSKNNEI